MFKRLRSSPAVLVAVLALVAALGGTAIAGSTHVTTAKKKKHKHKDAKDDTKLFNSLLKNATSAPKLVVLSAASATNAANAANAAHATSADSATTAGSLNGVTVTRFYAQVPTSTTDQTVGTVGPLTLLGSCDGSSNPTLKFKATEDASHLDSNADANLGGDSQLAAGNAADISGTPNFGAQGETQGVLFTSKKGFEIQWYTRDGPNSLGTGTGCLFSGFVTLG
jgi:hypothetical protein